MMWNECKIGRKVKIRSTREIGTIMSRGNGRGVVVKIRNANGVGTFEKRVWPKDLMPA